MKALLGGAFVAVKVWRRLGRIVLGRMGAELRELDRVLGLLEDAFMSGVLHGAIAPWPPVEPPAPDCGRPCVVTPPGGVANPMDAAWGAVTVGDFSSLFREVWVRTPTGPQPAIALGVQRPDQTMEMLVRVVSLDELGPRRVGPIVLGRWVPAADVALRAFGPPGGVA